MSHMVSITVLVVNALSSKMWYQQVQEYFHPFYFILEKKPSNCNEKGQPKRIYWGVSSS